MRMPCEFCTIVYKELSSMALSAVCVVLDVTLVKNLLDFCMLYLDTTSMMFLLTSSMKHKMRSHELFQSIVYLGCW